MLSLQAKMSFSNPTEYSAHVPFANVNILKNGTVLGNATVRDLTVLRGPNEDISVAAVWDPTSLNGDKGWQVGKELLSQYISGMMS